tara:strand:+ start:1663 stop:2166 length:504 start_codon:yes stop_codon:yes gene_type:complete
MSGGSEYVDPKKRFPKFADLITARQPQLTENADISRIAQTARQQLDWNAIMRPIQYKVAQTQIDSSSTGDTVLLTGVTNKTLIVNAVSAYASGTGNATFRFELDTGSSFGTTRRISKTDTNDKETQGQLYYLKSTDRIVVNVTSATGSSTIDVVVFYQESGYGAVYG